MPGLAGLSTDSHLSRDHLRRGVGRSTFACHEDLTQSRRGAELAEGRYSSWGFADDT